MVLRIFVKKTEQTSRSAIMRTSHGTQYRRQKVKTRMMTKFKQCGYINAKSEFKSHHLTGGKLMGRSLSVLVHSALAMGSVNMTVPALFHGHMPRHQNVLKLSRFLGLKGYKMNHEKLLLKNSFPKNNKEKNFVNNFGAHDPMHTFSKIYIDHLRVIRSLHAIYGPSAHHLIFKYRTSKTQKIFLVSHAPRKNFRFL